MGASGWHGEAAMPTVPLFLRFTRRQALSGVARRCASLGTVQKFKKVEVRHKRLTS
jgi:hypothetical protein